MDRPIAIFFEMYGMPDFKYTLFESGRIVHEFDVDEYPGDRNLVEEVKPECVKQRIKQKLLDDALFSDKELVRKLLNLTEDSIGLLP